MNCDPFLELQALQAGSRLLVSDIPPCETGTIWSSVLATFPQYPQQLSHASNTAFLANLRSYVPQWLSNSLESGFSTSIDMVLTYIFFLLYQYHLVPLFSYKKDDSFILSDRLLVSVSITSISRQQRSLARSHLLKSPTVRLYWRH